MDVRPTSEAARAPAIAPAGDRRSGGQQPRERRPAPQGRAPGRPPGPHSGYEANLDDEDDDGVSLLL